jgi:hypothetical protein
MGNAHSSTLCFLERIGSVNGTFLDECQTGEADTTLRCYQDVDMNYSPPSAPACDLISGIDEQTMRRPITVFPDPGTDHLTIMPSEGIVLQQVLMRDALGRICLRESPDAGSVLLDTRRLVSGCYSLEVYTSRHERYVRRWIKQ